MKKFNKRSPHGHELAQHTPHVDRTNSLKHLHQHRYNHVVRSASSSITEFGINFFILKVPVVVMLPTYLGPVWRCWRTVYRSSQAGIGQWGWRYPGWGSRSYPDTVCSLLPLVSLTTEWVKENIARHASSTFCGHGGLLPFLTTMTECEPREQSFHVLMVFLPLVLCKLNN